MLFPLCYLLLINAIGFLFMYLDKRNAQRNYRRTPEITLLGISFIGGSIGTLIGMYLFRHKTKHLLFSLLLPIMPALQLLLIIVLKGV